MTALSMGFMVFIFILMFQGWIGTSLLVLIAIVAGLLVGLATSKIVKN
jgi:hypothetical protein